MKRTLKYALTAVLFSAFALPALAQDNFPDVPENHWAYEALSRLKKDGLLVGYPDGLFRGGRPASRYELAVAIHATYVHLKNITDGLGTQVSSLSDKLAGTASADDVRNLRDALASVQNDVNTLKGYGADIENLKKLADTFQKELQSLGVDVEQLKKDLGDLNDRVTKLEKRKPAVDISGDVNLFAEAGNSRDHAGLSKDGYVVGAGGLGGVLGGTVNQVGLNNDLGIFHEAALTFTGTADTGPKWSATIVTGNLVGATGFTNQSETPGQGLAAGSTLGSGTDTFYVEDLGVKFDTSVAGLAFNADLGRVGYRIGSAPQDPSYSPANNFLFSRPDTTSYYSNSRWDDGLYRFDGGVLGFNFGGTKLDIIGGSAAGLTASNGTPFQPTIGGSLGGSFSGTGAFNVDRLVGANVNVPLGPNGNVSGSYLLLESNTGYTSGGVGLNNRIQLYGGKANYNFGPIKAEGGYDKSDLMNNGSSVNNSDDSAWYGKLSYGGDKWGIWGDYRVVEGNYIAPGDWGRLGILRNPQNIKGFQVGGHINIGQALVLKANGEFDKGNSDTFSASSGFTTDTKINKFDVGLDYRLNPNLSVFANYEDTKFESLATGFSTSGDPHYRWTTFGIGYGLSDAAKLLLQYEISDVDNEFVLPNMGFSNGANNTYKGGFLTTQLSVKF